MHEHDHDHDTETDDAVLRRFGCEFSEAIARRSRRPRFLRVRRSVLGFGVAILVGVPSAIAVGQELKTDQPEPAGPYETADDCADVIDLYNTVGMSPGYYYAPTCPTRDEVLGEIAAARPSAGIAELCEKALADGRSADQCGAFLQNRSQYLQGVAELEAEGIDLAAYRAKGK